MESILTKKHITIRIERFFDNHSFGILCCTQVNVRPWEKGKKTSWSNRTVDIAGDDNYVLDWNKNKRVLRRANEKRELVKERKVRKIQIIGHIISHNSFISNIIEDKVLAKEGGGRPRKTFCGRHPQDDEIWKLSRNERITEDGRLRLYRQDM